MFPRAKALGIVYRDDQILVEEFHGRHSNGKGTYYRPIHIQVGQLISAMKGVYHESKRNE